MSRWCPWCGSNVLRYSVRILLIDIERGDFDIDHRRFNPRVAHQLHQGRQANTLRAPYLKQMCDEIGVARSLHEQDSSSTE